MIKKSFLSKNQEKNYQIFAKFIKKISREKNPNPDSTSFFKTLITAIIFAGIIRSFLFEPFHIPSSSMKPNLLIGDYIFVSKYSYGYSKYSLPFSLNLFSDRFFFSEPKRGDVVVFRLPTNPKINYVKRLIGLPGDEIQMINGSLYINHQEVKKTFDQDFIDEISEDENQSIAEFIEKLPEGKEIKILDQYPDMPQDNTGIYKVPEGFYFMMGDNRDNSQDSRFLTQVGFVAKENLIGKATIIFFSTKEKIYKFWKLNKSIRFERIFQKIN
jgi:signal peptidase I